MLFWLLFLLRLLIFLLNMLLLLLLLLLLLGSPLLCEKMGQLHFVTVINGHTTSQVLRGKFFQAFSCGGNEEKRC
jgi:type IV secretory pathway VirB3-like protein